MNGRKYLTLEESLPLIGDAYLAQFCGKGYTSSVIRRATGSVHSHSAMLVHNQDVVRVLEMWWSGGQQKSLKEIVKTRPGLIDVYSPNADGRWPEFRRDLAVHRMNQLVSQGYGWRGLFRMVFRRTPGVWRFFPLTMSDTMRDKPWKPYCSHAAADSYECGGVDIVPGKPNHLVAPGHLSNSLFFKYQFTIGEPSKPRSMTKRFPWLRVLLLLRRLWKYVARRKR